MARLRALTGVENVVLCGLRLGASLAVQAVDALRSLPDNRVTRLMLLASVFNGRTYLREPKQPES